MLGTLVFLVVSELSRVSSEELDASIEAEVGAAGTHQIEIPRGLGVGSELLTDTVVPVLEAFTSRPIEVVTVFPSTDPDCPPFEELGRLSLLVVRDQTGGALPLPFGRTVPTDVDLCLGGQVIPASALHGPSRAEMLRWGTGLAVHPTYEEVLTFATTGAIVDRFVVVVDAGDYRVDDLEAAVSQALTPFAARQGLEVEDAVDVLTPSQLGGHIRAASDAIKLVYGAIGWGVLLLGALGLLVAELIVVRDRSWFFGLARAVGAQGIHIIGLVFADIMLVLMAGASLTFVAGTALEPLVSRFVRSAFEVDIQLLRPSVLPRLAVAQFVVLLVAAGYPAWRATRADPLDLLEGGPA